MTASAATSRPVLQELGIELDVVQLFYNVLTSSFLL
jgi:hypothetical protein